MTGAMTDARRDDLGPEEHAASHNAAGHAAGASWHEANQRYLAAALSELRRHLGAVVDAGGSGGSASRSRDAEQDEILDPATWTFSQPPALEQLCSAFDLSAL